MAEQPSACFELPPLTIAWDRFNALHEALHGVYVGALVVAGVRAVEQRRVVITFGTGQENTLGLGDVSKPLSKATVLFSIVLFKDRLLPGVTEDARSGSGPPVVLLHGLAEDHSSWQPVLSGFRNHTAFAVDLRGHGGSSCGHCDGTAEQLARDLTDFLEVVTGPAPVVGFSMGGSIALLGAAERPDMVTGLVVIATSCVVGRAAAEFFSDRISMVESGAMEELATALKEDTATQVLTEVDLDTLTAGRLAAIGDGAGYANAARAMMALRERPLTGRLAEVSCHVDVVSTDGDLFCPPRAGQMIVDGVADAAYHQIDRAGHLVTVDRPVALSALLDRLTSGMVGKGGSGPGSDRDVLDEGAK